MKHIEKNICSRPAYLHIKDTGLDPFSLTEKEKRSISKRILYITNTHFSSCENVMRKSHRGGN